MMGGGDLMTGERALSNVVMNSVLQLHFILCLSPHRRDTGSSTDA